MTNTNSFHEGRFLIQHSRLVRVIVNNTTLNAVQILPLPPGDITKKYNLSTTLNVGVKSSRFNNNEWVIKLDSLSDDKINYWGIWICLILCKILLSYLKKRKHIVMNIIIILLKTTSHLYL